jgi:hypothetical protein
VLRTTLAILVLVLMASRAPAHASINLLINGDFTRGSGESVESWRTDAWVLSSGTTKYRWIPASQGEPGEVEISSSGHNDARFVQGLSLKPGWYHISAEVRTRNVLRFFTGASVSVLEDGIMSQDLRGDNDWTPLGFYLHVGKRGADVDVALRLGGYMNLTRGQARFRHASVVKLAGPPQGGRVFELDTIRRTETNGPIGHLWTLIATFLALGGTTCVGWRMMNAPSGGDRTERLTRSRRP